MIMKPESKLDEIIRSDDELRKLSYKTIFHKVFHENIDEYFPYKELTLNEVGFPVYDILQVSTERGAFYVEMSKDAHRYGI